MIMLGAAHPPEGNCNPLKQIADIAHQRSLKAGLEQFR